MLYHVTVELLWESFMALKRRAAPGVDGLTWQDYEVGLEQRLTDLHARVHSAPCQGALMKRERILSGDYRSSR